MNKTKGCLIANFATVPTIKLFQRATDVVSVPTCAKPLKAPATEPIDIPVNGASQFWARFIAAPWLIYPVTWY
ncbi:hypothetical protein [Klebsiella pneumoniae]|uniref:hypothetical protein n=1 Tax=Klebsiella pneumoniae TaxID=573 RepID=UPI002815D702|nr:hypothetical protein [Klebsiella pneumoniae]